MQSRLAASLTLVTLWLLGEWRLLDRAYGWDLAYFSDGPVSPHFFAAVILSTVVLTAVATGIWAGSGAILRRYLPRWAERIAALGLLTATFVAIWHGGARAVPFSPLDGAWAVPVLLVITLVATLAVGLVKLAGVVRRALVAGNVAFPVFVLFTVWSAATGPSAAAWPGQAAWPRAVPSQVSTRLVWIIFDEWDAAISDERRPASLDLPAVDRLRAEAFVATHVQAPGAWTIEALPALWLGRQLAAVHPVGPGQLRVEDHDGTSASLDGPAGTVFEDLHRLGARVSLAGWYHDICGLFGAVTVSCTRLAAADAWPAPRRARFSRERGVVTTALAIVAWHFRNPLPVPRLRRHASEAMPEDEELRWIETRHPLMLDAVHDAVLRDVSRSDIDVVFGHYPIPHLPGVHPYRSSQTSAWDAATYVTNLRHMDRALSEIRSSMERAGLWDVSTVLISSDHPLRPEHWAIYPRRALDIHGLVGGALSKRVPFILKLANQPKGSEYPHPFSATVSRDLVVELVAGRVVDIDGLTAWLDRRRGKPAGQ